MEKRLIPLFLLVLGLLIPLSSLAQGIDRDGLSSHETGPTFPVFGLLNTYFFTGHFKAHLQVTELRIDHMADHTACTMPRRACRLSLGYSSAIGRNLGMSELELPLVGSAGVRSQWAVASMGDYVARFWSAPSNVPRPSSAVKLILTLAF